LKHEPGGCWTKEKRRLRLISHCLPAVAGSALGVRCIFASLLIVARKIFTEGNKENEDPIWLPQQNPSLPSFLLLIFLSPRLLAEAFEVKAMLAGTALFLL
jgi:hypothetical protein